MPEPLIILDLDDTLVDRRRLKTDIFRVVEQMGIPAARAKQVYNKMRLKQAFAPRLFAELLFPREQARSKALIKTWDGVLSKPNIYNFAGANKFVKTLADRYNLALLSYGPRSWQLAKLKQTGLAKFFSRIYITPDRTKRRALALLSRQTQGTIILIDDDPFYAKDIRNSGLQVVTIKTGPKDWNYYQTIIKQIEQSLD